jgi:hypothetical protein
LFRGFNGNITGKTIYGISFEIWFPAIETAVVAIGLPLIETDAPVSVTMFSPPS